MLTNKYRRNYSLKKSPFSTFMVIIDLLKSYWHVLKPLGRSLLKNKMSTQSQSISLYVLWKVDMDLNGKFPGFDHCIFGHIRDSPFYKNYLTVKIHNLCNLLSVQQNKW